MKVVLSRIDERLVHGQVIASWAKQLAIKRILVIDDKLANDSFMSDVLAMAAPTGVVVKCISTEDAFNELTTNVDEVNTMLLFKGVDCCLKLVKLGYVMQRLNVGNMGSGPSRKGITKRVFMSDEEVSMVKELISLDVFVYLQMLSSDNEVNIIKQI